MSDEVGRSQRQRVEHFRQVAAERISRLNVLWIHFEQSPEDEAEQGAAFLRELHTLKGEASLTGFVSLGQIAHRIETLAKPLVDQLAPADPSVGDSILEGFDLMESLLARSPGEMSPEAARYLRAEVEVEPARARPAARLPSLATDAIRITPERFDAIRDLVGELLLLRSRSRTIVSEMRKARQMVVATAAGQGGLEQRRVTSLLEQTLGGIEAILRDHSHQLGRTASELESTARDLRIVPIRTLFEQYPRAVRSLARELGKEVHLEITGEDIQVDRSVLEAISQPLIHLVRNSVDHGIEDREVRIKRGKSPVGLIAIRATLAGSTIRIEIADDGAGIDVKQVSSRAQELGLIGEQEARNLASEQLVKYIFHQGLSTRAAVTEVSGRGIGLDVVLKNIEAMGGVVTMTTEAGRGTTFILQVPISVAVTSLLLFRVGASRYAVPAAAVAAVLDKEHAPLVDGAAGPAVSYRDHLVPAIALGELLGELAPPGSDKRRERILVIASAGAHVALLGTEEHEGREVVLKTGSAILERDRLFAAAAPLDDGTLALVLKPGELVAASRMGQGDRVLRAAAPAPSSHTILVVDDSPVIRDLLAEALRSRGVRVLEAGDGQEALAVLTAHPEVKLLVTDIEMPRLDGIQLVREVRSGKNRRMPVLVVSMRGSDDDKRAALEAGADGYLVKADFTQAGLWSLVSRYLA